MLKEPKDNSFQVVLFGGRTFTAPSQSQVFTFERDDKPTLYFCINRLAELREDLSEYWETIDIPLDNVVFVVNTRGVDVNHAMSLSPQRVEEPGLAVFMDDGTFLIVDGSHRYVRRAFDGRDGMIFHVCRHPGWHMALIDRIATTRLWGWKVGP